MEARRAPRVAMLAAALGLVLYPALALRAAPASGTQLTFQARLTSPDGSPMTALIAVQFQLWDQPAPAGSLLWSEAHDGTALPKVQVRNGVLAVVLGQLIPLEPTLLGSGVADRWIGIVVGGEELTRVKLTASAFAVSAGAAQGIWNPSSGSVVDLAGLDARYVRTTGTGGNVLRSVNGVAPDAAGDFSLEAGTNVTVTPTANGLRIAATGEAPGAAVRTVNGVSPDAAGGFTVAAGSNVTVTPTANGIQIAATSEPVGTVVRSITGVSPDANGAFTISAGTNVTITPTANGLQISAAGGGLDVGTADARYVNSGFTDSAAGLNLSGSLIANEYVVANIAFQSRNGQIAFDDNQQAWIMGNLRVANFVADGTKSFVVPHPQDATKEIIYYSLEGPECGIYARGSATLANGELTVSLPPTFAVLAVASTITAQVTPTGDCRGLFVASKAPGQIVVRELGGGTSAATFDWVVHAKRLGTENVPVVRDRTVAQPPPPPAQGQ